MTPFEKQDIYTIALLAEPLPNPIYQPYYAWKSGKGEKPTLDQARAIDCAAAQELEQYYDKYPKAYANLSTVIDDDPWQDYRGFGEDYRIVSFLEGIQNEVLNFII